MAAEGRENRLRKYCFFTAIRQSYKTLVRKKNTALVIAKCRENWPNRLVNNFRHNPRDSRQLRALKTI